MSIKNNIARILLSAIIIMLTGYVMAQNTGTAPYLNSTHDYQISVGNKDNNRTWTIYNTALDLEEDIVVNGIEVVISHDIVSAFTFATANGGNERITIKFDDGYFTDLTADNYRLRYYEFASHPSGDICVAAREIVITVSENTFYLDLALDDYTCNAYSGHVWDNTTTDISTTDDQTTLIFAVNINKANTHLVTSWKFDGLLSITSGASFSFSSPVFTNTTGSTSYGTWAITNIVGNAFTLTVTVTNPATADYTTDQATIGVDIEGSITQDATIQLDLTNAKAYSDPDYPIETDDNILLGADGPDRSMSVTLFGNPNTPIVSVIQN